MSKKLLFILSLILFCRSISYSQYIRPLCPKDKQMIFSDTVHFRWNQYLTATTYHLQVATDTAFTHLLVNVDVQGTDTIVKGFWQDTTYYWRLKPQGGTYGPCLTFIYFTPRMIPDLVGWYCADSCHISDSLQHIDTLYDKSVCNNHLIQPNTRTQPVKTSCDTLLNRQMSIYYNGNSYMYTFLNSTYSQPNTMFLIWKNDVSSYRHFAYTGIDVNYRNQLYIENCILGQYAGVFKTKTIIADTFPYTKYESLYNGISSYTKINDTIFFSGNCGNYSMKGVTLGAYLNGSYGIHGYIPEFIYYNNMLDSIQSLKISQYLSEKYYGRLNLGENKVVSEAQSTILRTDKEYMNYKWNTGDTTPSIMVTHNGKYWLTTTNIYGWMETDTIDVFLNVPILCDTLICMGDSAKCDFNYKYAYNYQWSDGHIGQEFTSDKAGEYSVILIDSLQRKIGLQFNVFVDSLPYYLKIQIVDSLCYGNTITLDYPRIADGYDILWSTGDTNSLTTTFTQTAWYGVQVQNELGCIGKDSIYIIKKGNAPLTAFTATNICMGDSTAFINTSTTNDGTSIALSEWYLGDGETRTPVNAMEGFKHLYDTSGMYIVTLHCVTDAGCEQEYRQSVSVYSFPQPDFTPVLACQHSPVSFANLTRSEYRVGNYTWHFTPHDSSILALPEYTYHDTGMHTVQLIAANVMGCTDTMEHTLYVKPNPQATFTYNQPCVGNTLYLNDITPLPVEQKAVNRTWSVNGVLLYGTANHAQYAIDKEGNYRATLNMQYLNGCSSTAEADIIVHSLPQASFSVSPACQYDTLSISTATMAGLNYEWHYMGHTYTGSMPVISADSTGKHPLMLYVYDNNHCTDSAMQQVMVSPSPKADFSYDYAPHGLYTIQFTNHSLRADSYTWQFDNMGMSSEKHPVFDFLTAGTYEVSLSVANSGACTHEQKQQLILPEHRVEVSLMDFQLIEQNGTVRPQVLVLNRSNRAIPLLQYTFTYNNEQIYETDSLPLPAGEMRLYTFRTAMAAKQQADYACISLSTPYDDCPSADTDREKCLLLNKADFVQTPYPNPAHNNITLCYGLQAESEVTWQIYDVGGRQLYNCTHKQQAGGIYHKHIDIASLAQGLYILKVSIGEQVYSYKFNKQSN